MAAAMAARIRARGQWGKRRRAVVMACREKEWTVSCQFSFKKAQDRKSTRLNSSHLVISYAVFCLKKKQPLHLQVLPLPQPADEFPVVDRVSPRPFIDDLHLIAR